MEQQTEIMPHTNGIRRILSLALRGRTTFEEAHDYMVSNHEWTLLGYQKPQEGDFKVWEIVLAKGADDLPQIWFLGKENQKYPTYGQYMPNWGRHDDYDQRLWTIKCAERLEKAARFYQALTAYFYDLEIGRKNNADNKKGQSIR